MMSAVAKKLGKDYMNLERQGPPGVSGAPSDTDILEWDAIVTGPEDTPFQGGTFKLKLKFPKEYPAKPPTVWFYSKMFHPNVYPDGKICLDILEDPNKWNPDYDVVAVLCGIQAMLGDPNPESPANGVAVKCFQHDPEQYMTRVAEVVALSEIYSQEDRENLNRLDYEEALMEDFALALSVSNDP